MRQLKERVPRHWAALACTALAVVIFVLFCSYCYYVRPAAEKEKPVLVNSAVDKVISGLKGGDEIVQEVRLKDTGLYHFSVKLDASELNHDSSLNVSLSAGKTGRTIQTWKDVALKARQTGTLDFYLDETCYIADEELLKVVITLPADLKENEITLYQSTWNSYAQGDMYINQEKQDSDLIFSFYDNQAIFINYVFLLVAAVVLLSLLGLWLLFRHFSLKAEQVFLYLGIVFGIFYLALWPPYAAPDEVRHFATAYYYSNELMGKEAVSEDGRVMVRGEDLKYNNQEEFSRLYTYSLIRDHLFAGSSDNRMTAYEIEPMDVSFIPYIPNILGITLARLLNLSCVGLLFLGRFFNLAVYLALGWAILKKLPAFKWFMAFFMLIPGTLQMAAAFSYDMITNSCAFFYFAWMLELILSKRKVQVKDIIGISALTFFFVPIKVVYIFLLAMLFLLPVQEKGSMEYKRTRLLQILAPVIGVLSILLIRMTSLNRYVSSISAAPTVEWTIPVALSMPLRTLYVVLNTPLEYLVSWLKEIIWGLPMYSNMYFADGIIFMFYLCLIFACFIDPPAAQIKRSGKLIILGSCLVISLSLFAVFLFTDMTPITDIAIRGIQGRYFLPFLPWLLLLRPIRKRAWAIKNRWFLATAFFILQLYFVLQVFQTVITR